ncbi:hypothetical protein PGN_1923 [Porphyromonas gingivalis ATCC 33277]|uniref:Uncharacterized protein n=1 Tax=Porphyromonas gingivalis (strain ATCC 33277 / DSM 20709 / CIP 103683 / JCM 12257 / NCTC 11834 / 2561) TaxID=431947 RepID=B2RM47_PORG3|nr:hypothetical protein PGN_1923 [Porphyromonas gingivalis ATCC 33277]
MIIKRCLSLFFENLKNEGSLFLIFENRKSGNLIVYQ